MPGPEPTDDEMLEAKKRLYDLLMHKAEPTKIEVSVLFSLTFDQQIRTFLAEHIHDCDQHNWRSKKEQCPVCVDYENRGRSCSVR